jgi:hypothetical protein
MSRAAARRGADANRRRDHRRDDHAGRGKGPAASLNLYRSKIEDPKDAVVMLAALSVGLGSGVGRFAFLTFSIAFLVGALTVLTPTKPGAVVWKEKAAAEPRAAPASKAS